MLDAETIIETENIMPKPICIYHSHCADGFTAAWVVEQAFRFGKVNDNGVDLYPAAYDDAPPPDQLIMGRPVIIVDFSYPKDVLIAMSKVASIVLVLDHHKTAAANLDGLPTAPSVGYLRKALHGIRTPGQEPGPLYVQFDMERSGAAMAWDYLFPDSPRPKLVDYVQDRDLWKWRLISSHEINAYIGVAEKTLFEWSRIDIMLQQEFDLARTVGAYLLKQNDTHVQSILATSVRPMVIGGIGMQVANCNGQFASDVAGALAERATHGIGASYYDSPSERKFSLRRRGDVGTDVSEIAARYGGGGHAAAAEFSVPLSDLGGLR